MQIFAINFGCEGASKTKAQRKNSSDETKTSSMEEELQCILGITMNYGTCRERAAPDLFEGDRVLIFQK